jgi:hypothetical protein
LIQKTLRYDSIIADQPPFAEFCNTFPPPAELQWLGQKVSVVPITDIGAECDNAIKRLPTLGFVMPLNIV